MTPRDIEKLKAIGYVFSDYKWGGIWTHAERKGIGKAIETSDGSIYDSAKAHAQSPEGMKATMADKVRWLLERGRLDFTDISISLYPWGTLHEHISLGADPKKPEAAVDDLFWKVP